MGIYLPNMEMPKKGEYRMTLYVCDDGYAYMDVDLFPVDKDRFEAVPVPSHGDLIDRKELIKHNHQHYEYLSDEFYITVRDIENAPTIIPAEEE